MDEEQIPDVDLVAAADQTNAKREQLEYELLELEAQVKRYQSKELLQRFWLRWLAVTLGIVVVILMAAIMKHQLHSVFVGPFLFANSAFSVVIVVGPILSITTITIVFFVAAFRKFDDGDVATMSNGVAGGVNVLKGF
jgi:hypothetical protein